MKKTFNLILILSVALSSLLSAQNPPVTNQEIEDFDKKVAKMLPIPRQINVSVDVVGLEIGNNPAAEDQLSRTASAGTGTYYPVANAADLSKVFSKITTGGGGGGGGRIMSRTSSINWPLLLGILFLFGSAGLLVGILVSRMHRTAAPATAVPKDYATLHITYLDGGTKSVAISDLHSTLGRNENNHVVINDIDVSGIHAEIFISQEGFLLRDSSSTNGTLINGLRITEQYLYLGDEIMIGSTRMIFGS